jgi:hypothetical protein
VPFFSVPFTSLNAHVGHESLAFDSLGSAMPQYRVYTLNKLGRIFGPADLIEADNDEDAIVKAKRLQTTLDLELWQDNRAVTKLPAGKHFARSLVWDFASVAPSWWPICGSPSNQSE